MSPIRLHELRIAGRFDPLETYLRLAGSGGAVLLDGPSKGGPWAERAYIAFDPYEETVVPAGGVSSPPVGEGGVDPLRDLFDRLPPAPAAGREGDPPGKLGSWPRGRFRGGLAGFLSYDLGRSIEALPCTARAETSAPDLWFGGFNRGVEIDLRTGDAVVFVVELADSDRSGRAYVQASLEEAVERMNAAAPMAGSFRAGALRSNFSRTEYMAAVETVREHILAGDVYQVNLAQRFQADFTGDPRGLYARLRDLNPAPFAALVETGEVTVLSSSPERFLAVRGGEIETCPIKGTRRRTGDVAADTAAARALEHSEKDGAELAMIVDLLRNDVGRVAALGSVTVQSAGHIEAFATVLHRVAVIRARLAQGRSGEHLLRAAFPGGSITGAPRIRAMEVIEALEGTRRGVFTGSIGWIGYQGDLDLNIVIRTMVVEGGAVHFHAGGGITLDSDAGAEYDETLAKADALARALGQPLP